MVQECACSVIRRTVFNVYICLNHISRYKHNKLEMCHEKPRHQKAVFSKFRQFSYLSVFRERRKCLTCTFVKYALSKLYSYSNQNVIFTTFRDYILFCNKKLFNIFLGLCYYFLLKPVKMILENHSLNLSGQHIIRSVI